MITATADIAADFKEARHIDGVLLPYQQRWIADRHDVKVCEKSRRVGISWAEAADDSLYSASQAGDDTWYIGYTKDMAREFIDDCAFWMKFYNLAAGDVEEFVFADEKDGEETREILAYRINCASGHKVVALSSSPRNLRGKQGRVVIDEEAFHQQAKELRKAAIALLMWGGKVRIISTHNGEDNDFNELVNDIRAGKIPYGLHHIDLDEALADGLYRRICLVLKRTWTADGEKEWRDKLVASYGEAAQEELFVIPSKGSGIFMSRALIESCMKDDIPVIRKSFDDQFVYKPKTERESEVLAWCEDHLAPLLAKLDPDRTHYFGEDFGRSGDLTCLWPGAEKQNLLIRVPFVVELHNCPFEQQTQVAFFIIDRLPKFRHGCFDARGNGQYLAEVAMQRYSEFRISQVMISPDFYRDAMPKYKDAYESKNIEIPKDADILEDHRLVKMEKGIARIPDERTTGADRKKRHGDSAIAGAMLWMASRHEGPEGVGVYVAPESVLSTRTRTGSPTDSESDAERVRGKEPESALGGLIRRLLRS